MIEANKRIPSKSIGKRKVDESAKVEEVVEAGSPPEPVETPLGKFVELYPFPYNSLPASQMSGSLDMNLSVCTGLSLTQEQKEHCTKMGRFSILPEGGAGDTSSYFIWNTVKKCYTSNYKGVQKTPNRLKSTIHGSIDICFKGFSPSLLTIFIENPFKHDSGPYGIAGQPPTSNIFMKAEGNEFSIQLDRKEMLIGVNFAGKFEMKQCAISSLYQDSSGGAREFRKDECYTEPAFNGNISGSIKGKPIPLFNRY